MRRPGSHLRGCRSDIFGPKKLEQVRHGFPCFSLHMLQRPSVQFLSFMWNSLSLGSWKVPLSSPSPFRQLRYRFYEERNAGNAVQALMDSLAPKAMVKRDGKWAEIE